MVRVRLIGWEKVYVLPASQPNPNIPKIRVKIFVTDYNELMEVDADWSDDVATRNANALAAIKETLQALYDEIKGEYEYNPSTDTLNEIVMMREIYFGENPPSGTPEEGDMWYNPVEDRFKVYVIP